MQNSTSDPYVAPVFSPPSYAVAVNALFFASLGVVLIAAFLCMLVKGWIRELDRNLRGIPDLQKRAVIKELREQGLARWRFRELITILPSLIHLSLVLFFIGLALYLLQVHILPAFLSISIFGFGVTVYVFSIFISAIDDFSPFRSMYSRALGVLYRRLYSRFLSLSVLRFSLFSALPQNTSEKLREWVSTFIKSHEPRFEQDILDPLSSSSKQIISQISAPVLNRLWCSVDSNDIDTSTYAKDISTSIMLQLDDLNIRRPHGWWDPWLYYKPSDLSIKEVKCLVYNACMQKGGPDSLRFWEIIYTSSKLLNQHSDPWCRLVTLLIRMKVGGDCWDTLKSRDARGGQLPWMPWICEPNIPTQEAEFLKAVSEVNRISKDQWCFVLSSISTITPRFYSQRQEQLPATARILSGLLRMRAFLELPPDNKNIDFWLHVMMSLLDRYHESGASSQDGAVLHARDIEACGECNLRDSNYIRRLLRISRSHRLDPSLMGGCLVTILYILLSNPTIHPPEVMLINEYLKIIGEEMDVFAWSTSLDEVVRNRWDPFLSMRRSSIHTSHLVTCLLRGSYSQYGGSRDEIVFMMREYDSKLSAACVQPTTSILSLMDLILWNHQSVPVLTLQNAWLSLYAHNFDRLSYTSALPDIWSSECTSIASSRLDLYDHHIFSHNKVAPEIDLIIFFLSSPSTEIARRALHWYLHLRGDSPPPNDTCHFIAFPAIFHKGPSGYENYKSWLLLMNTILPKWDSMSPEEQLHFAVTFFGCGRLQGSDHTVAMQCTVPAREEHGNVLDPPDMVAPVSPTQADGLGWMEDVWMTVLQSHIDRVDRVDEPWLGLSEFVQFTCPESTHTTQPGPISASGARHEEPEAAMPRNQAKIGPKTMNDLAREFLSVLAQLLEAGADSMLDTFLDRVRKSPLISDRNLKHDVGSLCRIQRVLDRNLER